MAREEIRRILRAHPDLSSGNEVDLGPFGTLPAVRALRARYPGAGTLRTLIEREAGDLVEIAMDLSPTGLPTVAVIVPLDPIIRGVGQPAAPAANAAPVPAPARPPLLPAPPAGAAAAAAAAAAPAPPPGPPVPPAPVDEPWVVIATGHRTVVIGSDGNEHANLADEGALLAVLPPRVSQYLQSFGEDYLASVVDVALDIGRPVQIKRSVPRDPATPDGVIRRRFRIEHASELGAITMDDINAVLAGADQPVDALRRIVLPGMLHRLGVLREAQSEDVVGFTCRFGRAYGGLARALASDVLERVRDLGHSLLIVGPPGSGKTSTLRDMVRCLAEQPEGASVMVVDQSQEIGGGGIIPHASLGLARRLLMPPGTKQSDAMLEAVINHTPEVLVVDEIGTHAAATVCQSMAERGVSVIATVHGSSLWSVLNNADVNGVLGGISEVVISDAQASREPANRGANGRPEPLVKTKRESKRPPAFQEIIILDSWDMWTLLPFMDQRTVRAALRGEDIPAVQRRRLPNGDIEERNIMLSDNSED